MLIFNRVFVRWIADAQVFWKGLVAAVGTVIAALFVPLPAELDIRIAGYTLTLIGVFAILRSVNAALRQHGQGAYHTRLRAYIARFWPSFLGRRPGTVIVAGTAGMVILAGRARARVKNSSKYLPDRVSLLERQIASLEDNLDNEVDAREVGDKALDAAMGRAAAESKAQMGELRQSIQQVATGGWNNQVIGAIWAIIGQVCTTFPVEIAKHLPTWAAWLHAIMNQG